METIKKEPARKKGYTNWNEEWVTENQQYTRWSWESKQQLTIEGSKKHQIILVKLLLKDWNIICVSKHFKT